MDKEFFFYEKWLDQGSVEILFDDLLNVENTRTVFGDGVRNAG